MNWQKGKSYKTIGGWEAMYCGVDDDGDHLFTHYSNDGAIDPRYHESDGVLAGCPKEYNITTEEWQEPRVGVTSQDIYNLSPEVAEQSFRACGYDKLVVTKNSKNVKTIYLNGEETKK